MSFVATQLIGFGAKRAGGTASPTLTVVILTSCTSWSVPADWNSSVNGAGGFANKVETVGGAGGGSKGFSAGDGGSGGGGGGGGAYSLATNTTLTPGGSATYAIGAAGAGSTGSGGGTGGDTYFNGASLAASSVGSKGGAGGVDATASATPGNGGRHDAVAVCCVGYGLPCHVGLRNQRELHASHENK